MRFLCPNCHRELETPDESAGTVGTCYHCGAPITAPAADGQPAAAAEIGQAPGSVPQTPSGTLDLGAIVSEAWQTAATHWGILIPGFLVVLILTVLVQNVPTELLKAAGAADAAMLVGIVLTFVALPLQSGMWYLADSILLHGSAEIGLVFQGYKQAWPLIMASILQGFAVGVVVLVLAVLFPVLFAGGGGASSGILAALLALGAAILVGYIGIGVMWTVLEVVDKDAPPLEAIKTSWRVTEGRRLSIFVILLVLGLIGIAGLLALCVGILFTLQVMFIGQMIIYRQLRGLHGGGLNR